MDDATTGLDWRDGVPVSRRFQDPYFSLAGGLEETDFVFLAGNGLPGRFRDGFCIGELGFGTGLNLLATWAAWRQAGAPGRLDFVSFEAYPMAPQDRARALAVWPALTPAVNALNAVLADGGQQPGDPATLPAPLALGDGVHLTLILGDVRDTLPRWQGRVDAWYLDGFAPARNPQMWEDALLARVADCMAPGGTLATYTAAGVVRRALAAAGLEVARAQGYGRKRHMTTARKPAESP